MSRLLVGFVAVLAPIGCGSGDEAPRQPVPVESRVAPTPALGPKVFPLARAAALEDRRRDSWQHPEAVIDALAVAAGDRIADIGCGTGYFTFRLADATGPTGRVLAVDIQQGMLDIVAGRMTPRYRQVIEVRLSDPSRPLEADDLLDLVFCANILHEVDDADQKDFVARLADGLRPGGRLALINWLPNPMRLGPPVENRISPERVRMLAAEAGLELLREHDLLPTHSYFVFGKLELEAGS